MVSASMPGARAGLVVRYVARRLGSRRGDRRERRGAPSAARAPPDGTFLGRARRNSTVGRFRQLPHFLRIDISCDDHESIGRSVVTAVEVHGVGQRQRCDLLRPAEHGRPVGVIAKEGGGHLLVQDVERSSGRCAGAVPRERCRARQPYLARSGEGSACGPLRTASPSRDAAWPCAGSRPSNPALVSALSEPPSLPHRPLELACLVSRGRLEHQVLDEVGEARPSRRLVGPSHPIPDHVRDDRRALVLDDKELKAIVERRELRRRSRAGRHRVSVAEQKDRYCRKES